VSNTDSIHWRIAPRPQARLFALAVRAPENRAELRYQRFEVRAGEALVGDHGVAMQVHASEHLGGDLALGHIRGGQLKRDRHAVRCAQQVQPKAPEVAAVAGAVAVRGVASELRALDRFPGLPARHRGAVQQPDVVAPRRRGERDHVQQPDDLRRQRAHALVVARLLGQTKQMPEAAHRKAQKPPLGRDVEQDLRDRQADQLGVGDLRVLSWY
jgi:hypothetical protein